MLTRVWAFSPCRWTARAVDAVVIVGATREFGGDLAGEVDAGAGMEPQTRGVLQHRREAELQTELIEVHIAALRDRIGEDQVAVTLGRPAAEEPVAVLEAAATR